MNIQNFRREKVARLNQAVPPYQPRTVRGVIMNPRADAQMTNQAVQVVQAATQQRNSPQLDDDIASIERHLYENSRMPDRTDTGAYDARNPPKPWYQQ